MFKAISKFISLLFKTLTVWTSLMYQAGKLEKTKQEVRHQKWMNKKKVNKSVTE